MTEEPVQPKHRDPVYRRRHQTGYKPNRKPTVNDLIAEYAGYFKWITYLGFTLGVLVAIDYLLPYKVQTEPIVEIYTVTKSSARYARIPVYAYDVVVLGNGKRLRMYNNVADHFGLQDNVTVYSTVFFSKPIRVLNDNNNYIANLGYFYHTAVVLFPLVLFIITSLAIILRNRVQFMFNVSIVSIVLIIIVLYLIITL